MVAQSLFICQIIEPKDFTIFLLCFVPKSNDALPADHVPGKTKSEEEMLRHWLRWGAFQGEGWCQDYKQPVVKRDQLAMFRMTLGSSPQGAVNQAVSAVPGG